MLTRRHLLLGAAAALGGCRTGSQDGARPMPALRHRPVATLPHTALPWLSLRDHFVATVGAHAGRGQPLGPLLVLADATFAPRSRFPLHPHREMEILSVVIDGTLSHHGDQAHGAALGPRSAQLISARDGMVHAEGNDTDLPTRMLQLWFQPDRGGGAAAYFARTLDGAGPGRHLIAGDPAMPLRADVEVWWLEVPAGGRERVDVPPGRAGYLLALTGPLRAVAPGGGHLDLATGDGAEAGPGTFALTADRGGAALWIDLPGAAPRSR
jgi:redox-sensitive bicupin YhaK (pirin superfamily)